MGKSIFGEACTSRQDYKNIKANIIVLRVEFMAMCFHATSALEFIYFYIDFISVKMYINAVFFQENEYY